MSKTYEQKMFDAALGAKDNAIVVGNCPTCNHFPTQFIAEDGKIYYRELKLKKEK